MNGQELIERFVAKSGVDREHADRFYKEFFQVLTEGLEKEGYVRVKGLGSFKLLVVERRESVNVNTGERFEIQGHNRISFTPEPGLKELVNKPFAHLETVMLEAGSPVAAEAVEAVKTAEKEADPVVEAIVEPVAESAAASSAETVVEPVAAPIAEPVSVKPSVAVEKSKPRKEESPTWIKVAGWIMAIIFVLCVIALLMLYVPGLRKIVFEKRIQKAMETEMQIEAKAAETLSDATEAAMAAEHAEAASPISAKTTVESAVTASTPRAAAPAIEPDSVNYNIVGTQAEYTIGEGETLARVALHFYGTKALWPYIVKYNQTIIPNPDKVTSGLRVRIPRLERKGE